MKQWLLFFFLILSTRLNAQRCDTLFVSISKPQELFTNRSAFDSLQKRLSQQDEKLIEQPTYSIRETGSNFLLFSKHCKTYTEYYRADIGPGYVYFERYCWMISEPAEGSMPDKEFRRQLSADARRIIPETIDTISVPKINFSRFREK